MGNSSVSAVDYNIQNYNGNQIDVPNIEDILIIRIDFWAEPQGDLWADEVGFFMGYRKERSNYYTYSAPGGDRVEFCGIVTRYSETENPIGWAMQQQAIAEYGSGCVVRGGIKSYMIDSGMPYLYAYLQTWGAFGKSNGANVSADFTAVYYSIPEEEPSGPSECDAVQGEDGSSGSETSSWISMPQIMIRPGSCTQIGGWTISLGWISNVAEAAGIEVPEAIQIFGLNVCFTEINFGEIGILGIKINLDLLAAVAAGVALIRIFR